jgi:hypothetical protein
MTLLVAAPALRAALGFAEGRTGGSSSVVLRRSCFAGGFAGVASQGRFAGVASQGTDEG